MQSEFETSGSWLPALVEFKRGYSIRDTTCLTGFAQRCSYPCVLDSKASILAERIGKSLVTHAIDQTQVVRHSCKGKAMDSTAFGRPSVL
jgi:hypothetical protein